MVEHNTSTYGTAFTISIEAAEGVTTGVSAADRVKTIKAAIAEKATPQSLHSPGHVFPLIARPGGVKERGGHTEGSVELMKLAGFQPYAVLCELTNDDGTMAKLPEIIEFSKLYNYPVMSINDLKNYNPAPDFLPELVGSLQNLLQKTRQWQSWRLHSAITVCTIVTSTARWHQTDWKQPLQELKRWVGEVLTAPFPIR